VATTDRRISSADNSIIITIIVVSGQYQFALKVSVSSLTSRRARQGCTHLNENRFKRF